MSNAQTSHEPNGLLRLVELSHIPTGNLRPSARNARTHSKRQHAQLKKSVIEHGHMNPILADELLEVIAGHALLAVARDSGLETVPVIIRGGLSERQKRTLMLADNKIAANAGWHLDILAAELKDLVAIEEFDISLTGFEAPEVDRILFDREDNSSDPADACPEPLDAPVTRRGDLWLLGKYRLLCGDARELEDLTRLCGTDRAAMAFLDPPYNVRVSGMVGRGATKHAEFAMASGEMTPAQFQAFLQQTLGLSARFSRDGAVHFVCMDWRHVEELMAAGRAVYGHALNLIAWVSRMPARAASTAASMS